MAKKINLGLDLDGQDAIDFKNYIANPEYTPRVLALLESAWQLSIENVNCEGRIRLKHEVIRK